MAPFSDNKNNREFDKYRETPSSNTVVAVTTDPDAPIAAYLVNSTGFEYADSYSEVLSLASGSEVDLVTYTVPASKIFYLEVTEFGGTNIARYRIDVDGTEISKAYTWFSGPLFSEIRFDSIDTGKPMTAGQVITIKVMHSRPAAGDFHGRIQGVLRDV